MKKLILLFVTTALCFCSLPIFASASEQDVMPILDSNESYHANFDINSVGLATVVVNYTTAQSNFSKIKVSVTLQRKLWNLFWVSVDVGEPDNKWIVESYDTEGILTKTFALAYTGNYRANFKIEFVDNNGSTEVYEESILKSYN